jgi:hypothetical protein
MTGIERSGIDRRRVVALGGAAALAGLAMRGGNASADSVRTGGGIAGGGWVAFGPSEAQFSVFGSRFVSEETGDPIVVGSFIWVDAAGFSLTSTRIDDYGPDPDQENARIMTGLVQHSQTGNTHIFWLRLVDGGGPGEELDTIELIVGVEADDTATPVPEVDPLTAMVNINSPVAVGDLQLLEFDFDAAAE